MDQKSNRSPTIESSRAHFFVVVVFLFGEGIYMVYTISQNVYETIAIVAISLWHLHIQSYTDFGDKGGEKD